MSFDWRRLGRFCRLWLFHTPWTLRRLAVAAAFFLLFPLLELAIWTGLALDEILFRGYRRRKVEAPVFVVGHPRSGTTFLHRLLAGDRGRFVTMSMWEILFAPSITQRRLLAIPAAVDRLLGRPWGRFNRFLEARWRAWNKMQPVSLTEPEEDDYLLLHRWSALAVGLSAGLLGEARPFARFDHEIEAPDRARILRFYERCVQRHLYARARRRPVTYLAKNPSLTPKLASVLETFPDARIVVLVRNPLEALPSYLSLMRFTWRTVGLPAADGPELADFLVETARHWYTYPVELLADRPPESYCVVDYDDLARDPEGAVRGIYERLGLEVDEPFAAVLADAARRARGFVSRHDYDLEQLGLDRAEIVEKLARTFERFGFDRGTEPRPEVVPRAPDAGAGA